VSLHCAESSSPASPSGPTTRPWQANGVFQLPVNTVPQPDETTCGPTCLHAVYTYWGESERLSNIIARLPSLEHGGTFAVFLGCDALRKGYRARIYTYNLMVFDPTWFTRPHVDLTERLTRQRERKTDVRLRNVTDGYLEFLSLGGRIRLVNLSQHLIRAILKRGLPLLTGLSSTYLYQTPRVFGPQDEPDDIRGFPEGHFVVIAGWDEVHRKVLVVDPYQPNRYGPAYKYWIGIDRVIAAILLGIVTHDANLLVIYPPQLPGGTDRERASRRRLPR
jgi:hypothetical protein